MLTELKNWSLLVGLKLNSTKTKFMRSEDVPQDRIVRLLMANGEYIHCLPWVDVDAEILQRIRSQWKDLHDQRWAQGKAGQEPTGEFFQSHRFACNFIRKRNEGNHEKRRTKMGYGKIHAHCILREVIWERSKMKYWMQKFCWTRQITRFIDTR